MGVNLLFVPGKGILYKRLKEFRIKRIVFFPAFRFIYFCELCEHKHTLILLYYRGYYNMLIDLKYFRSFENKR